MEMTSFADLVFNPIAQAKFVHTISAGYVTGAVFVLGVSSWYLLKRKNIEFARRSFRIAASFGLAAVLSVIVLGDESGYTAAETQQPKMAAMEAMWHTEPAPAGLTVFGFPDPEKEVTNFEIKIPYLLGLIGTRSTDKVMPGIKELKAEAVTRIESGAKAVTALEKMRKGDKSESVAKTFNANKDNLGYGLLLKKYTQDVSQATPEMIQKAAASTIPSVVPMFWTFRIMVLLGFMFLALMVVAFYYAAKNQFMNKPWLLKWALWSIPLPWIACEVGWFVAEYGRQPWTIYGVLPTHLSTSSLTSGSLIFSLTGFVVFYTLLLIAELYLMFKYARLGPASLGTGRYEGEQHV
jgi:cytochrome d ubiquinol oxidase subunit I